MQWGDIDEQLVGYRVGNDPHAGPVAAFKKRSQGLRKIFCAQPSAGVDQRAVDPDGVITPLEAFTLQVFELIADTHVRRPERERPEPRFTTATPEQVAERLRKLVEEEQARADAERRTAIELLQDWGKRWNKNHAHPEAPSKTGDQAYYLRNWVYWYARRKHTIPD